MFAHAINPIIQECVINSSDFVKKIGSRLSVIIDETYAAYNITT